MTIITWRTHKTDQGFSYLVYECGYGVPNRTLKTGVLSTRAQAMAAAKKYTRMYKQANKNDAVQS